MDIKLQGLHSVLFFGNFSFSPLQIVNDLNKWSDGLFDGDPIIPPLPNDVPSDFPRAVLNNVNKEFTLIISLARLDFIQQLPLNSSIDRHRVEESYFLRFEKIIKNLKEDYRVKVGRIGCLGIFSLQLAHKPNNFLYKNFLSQNQFFGNSKSLEIHSLSKEVFDNDININRWFRIKTIEKPPNNDNIIIIEIDINTFQEEAETNDFKFEEIQKFYKMAFGKFFQDISNCFQE
jgi:hypothetical protein